MVLEAVAFLTLKYVYFERFLLKFDTILMSKYLFILRHF